MTKRYPGLDVLDGFREDIKNLLQPAQIMALQILVDVHAGDISGEPLDDHSETGDLSDCFKFYFDSDPAFQDTPRFRLVYQRTETGLTAVGVETIGVAVGRRAGLEVYRRAVQNLGR